MSTPSPFEPAHFEQISEDNVRSGLSVESLRQAFAENLFYMMGKHPARATTFDIYMAVSYSVRDRIMHRTLNMLDMLIKHDFRLVCYLSAEYLLGPLLSNNLINLGIYENAKEALNSFGIKLDKILAQEPDPGLGTGGLGRLAACYLDSLATLEYPSIAYGIRYEFGMFEQVLQNGWQLERTDKWLNLGNPWEIARPESYIDVKLGGRTETYQDSTGNLKVRWNPDKMVKGVPYDTPMVGYRVNNSNILRLWKAEATESFNFEAFNLGDYYKSVEAKMFSENITKVLYPNDIALQGKQLRLEQQYFFVSCTLQDMLRILRYKGKKLEEFPEIFTVQLNDTHPSIGVAELMRLLVDEHGMEWEKAWEITTKTFAYTNHTLLPEALEKWSVSLFGCVLPRHLEIIYEINRRFLEDVTKKFPGDQGKLSRMSLFEETGEKSVRMANLACVGSHKINGVAELHTELLKKLVLPDFVEMWPEKFLNVTNGVTPRRFIVSSNPRLTKAISKKIGTQWITHLEELHHLEAWAEDDDFQADWQKVKLENKKDLAGLIHEHTGIVVFSNTLFDVMIKRFHEYKRQHLKVLHIIALYNRLKKDPELRIPNRTFIFGGKAAPGYYLAKLIIKMITSVANVVNKDSDIKDRLKVVLFPNYNVRNAQKIIPGADLSEQISTAGKEASGTGNMKLAMNGAVTIGTLDGANIEILKEVSEDNFFTFGLKADEVLALKRQGYRPRDYYNNNSELKLAIDQLADGMFSLGDKELFRPLIDNLLTGDPYMVLADFQNYLECQDRVDKAYLNPKEWTRMSILNTSRIGKFSSDRAIKQYCDEIWQVTPKAITDKELLR